MASTEPVRLDVPVRVELTGKIGVTVNPDELDDPTPEAITERAKELALSEVEDGWVLEDLDVSEAEVDGEPEIVENWDWGRPASS